MVQAWEEGVVIPTYPAPPPDKNPMFLEKRVYQGSTGKVYPNPFTDRVSDEKVDRQYKAVFLENEYLRLMILPEIGGRIHIALDKTNNYDFIYRQNVIKPALVGLLGPWISGGVEFNWPQHHRPSTFMPVEYCIEAHEDGSKTVWLSEHEPMNRMKGMVGICLYPAQSIIEAKVRLYNRSPLVQTFLWWANVGIRVHDQYQAFFPPDVTFVADHAKRAISWYPIARNYYYGVDYTRGVDIAWYKNIPVPTSYMVTKSEYDFFGGYDHSKKAGIVHFANHHIAPGKKLWTWGNAEFGYAWDRELTDADGPYIELMAGVYTDNQPDFSWLQPYETKVFSQYWYPIREIGSVKNANRMLAVNLERADEGWKVGVCATRALQAIRILLRGPAGPIFECEANVSPGQPFVETASVPSGTLETDLLLRVIDKEGGELIRYAPGQRSVDTLPGPATEPPSPGAIVSNEELYLTGLHLEQYRHATRYPEPYWEEALRRDPEDVRCNNALGLLALRRGSFKAAEERFQVAIARLTRCNPNPYDGEPFYNLGLALKFQQRDSEAYRAFHKAVWNYAWQAAAYYALGEIECARGDFESALQYVVQAQKTSVDHLKARNLQTAILRRLGRMEEARKMAVEAVELDPLDFWSRNELVLLSNPGNREAAGREFLKLMRHDPQNCLDLVFDYSNAGLWEEAEELIDRFLSETDGARQNPMLLYTRAYLAERHGDSTAAARFYHLAVKASPDYCFPARLEELLVLEAALRHASDDARAHYYLGNLLYDRLRREEAMPHWEEAFRLDPTYAIPARNLGIAYYNVRRDIERAVEAYRRAREANPSDARLLYEFDQLQKRTGVPAEKRLEELGRNRSLVDSRDDLTIELVTLYNQIGQSARALSILGSRRFHPWEGGEGLVSGQYVAAHILLGRDALDSGDAAGALQHFEDAREYPQNLGEGKHLLTQEADIHYFRGIALSRLGRDEEAQDAWRAAAASARREPDLHSYYAALALRKLGDEKGAIAVLEELFAAATRQMSVEPKIDYFATSLPNFLLFEDDLQKRNQTASLFLRGLAEIGLGNFRAGEEDLRQALALDRDHLWAQVELERTLGKRKIVSKA